MNLDNLWQDYFGSGWNKLSDSFNRVGAFILDEADKAYKLDENALKIIGLGESPEFIDLDHAIRRMQKHLDISTPIRIRFITDDEARRAGYIYVEEEKNALADGVLPVINQNRLIQVMGGNVAESLLVLVQIDGVTSQSLENAYIYSAVNTIRDFIPNRGIIAAQSSKRYWIYIPDFDDEPVAFMHEMQDAVKKCTLKDEFGYVISEHHSMTITVGIGYNDSFPAERMHTARFALFEAVSQGPGSISAFSIENYETQKDDYQDIRLFSKLVDNNLFVYHFQPIINAHTGQIVAYEILMRSDPSIGMGPGQILDIAKKYDRLYDIERATLSNAYRYLYEHHSEMNGAKLYINSISGHHLRDVDYHKLVEKYGSVMGDSLIELTEQTEVSDETMEIIHNRFKNSGIQMAIDDYGTGYSNTSNLIRYNPSVVKIDRSLITHIESNQKTMNIVGNIIDFLHNNGYLALAEGVETYEELETMIGLGADLIQGFYISKPLPELLHEIKPEIKKQIEHINLENSKGVSRVYHPSEGEEVNILSLATDNYTSILVDVPHVSIVGKNTEKVPMLINVKDDVETEIKIHDVFMSSVSSMEVLHLGPGANVHLICSGRNSFDRKGVLVNKTSSLTISGVGELNINTQAKNAYAIGNDSKHSHGNITIDMNGRVTLSANGDTCVGIGGGHNREHNKIRILRGMLNINCSGGECVGIGTFEGGTDVEISQCSCRIKLASPTAVGIGSLKGSSVIKASHFDIDCNSTGTGQVGLGVLEEGTGLVDMECGKLAVTLRGEDISCIGTRDGEMDINISSTTVICYCEGNNISGIGDMYGGGHTDLHSDDLYIKFITGNGYAIGSPNGILDVDNCKKNFHINE